MKSKLIDFLKTKYKDNKDIIFLGEKGGGTQIYTIGEQEFI